MTLRGPTSRNTPSDRIAANGAMPRFGHLTHPGTGTRLRSAMAEGRRRWPQRSGRQQFGPAPQVTCTVLGSAATTSGWPGYVELDWLPSSAGSANP
jgi:hypothetical protein